MDTSASIDVEAAGSSTVHEVHPAPSSELSLRRAAHAPVSSSSANGDRPRPSTSDSQSVDDSAQPARTSKLRAFAEKGLRFCKSSWGTLAFIVFGVIALLLLGFLSFDSLSWKGWCGLIVLLLLLAGLVNETFEPHICMATAVLAFLVTGIIDSEKALAGFANEGVATVAVLFIVAEGISQTGVLLPVFNFLLGRPRFLWEASLRLLLPVGLISGFLNNTPVIAFMIPVVLRWCRRSKFPPAKFLMPLNDATALGGTLTLIGTSTNLVVVGLAKKSKLDVHFNIFGPAPIGAVVLVVGLVYLVIANRWLPDRGNHLESFIDNARNYTVALRVMPKSSIVGDTIETAGLRHLRGLFLIEITREDGEVLPAPDPETPIHVNDIMLFAGDVDTVTELYLIQGLVPATTQTEKLDSQRHRRKLVEVVVSPSSSILVGRTVRDTKFRTRFNAAIVAVHRGKEHVLGRIGDIILHGGDALLIETDNSFITSHKKDSNFALVAEVPGSQPPRGDYLHMAIAAISVITMIAVATANVTSLLTSASCAILIMLLTACISLEAASTAINIPVMLTVALSFGVANGLSESGAAAEIAKFLAKVFKGAGKVGLTAGIYLATAMIGAIVSNNAAVALMFPIVADPKTGLIELEGLNPYGALYAMMFAASADFSTPIGAQTNLMCHVPGGYKFLDWTIFGVPLQLLVLVVTIVMVSIIHPS